MSPELLAALAAIKSVCDMVAEIAKVYQTEEGRKVIEKMLADRAVVDSVVAKVGDGLTKLFTGQLWEGIG